MARGFNFIVLQWPALLILAALFAVGLCPNSVQAEPRIYLTSQMRVFADGKEIRCSWWNDHCEFGSTFDNNDEAKAEYAQYQSIAYWTPYFRWGAIGAFLGYSLLTLGTDHNYDAGTALITFLIPWIAGNAFSRRAGLHLVRAVNIINGIPPDQAANSPSAIRSDLPPTNSASASGLEWRTSLLQYSF